VDYFRSLFHGRLRRTPSFAWSSLASAVADLPAPELLDDVRQGYAEDLVDTMTAELEDIERDATAPESRQRGRDYLITDAIAELKGWVSFQPKAPQPGWISPSQPSNPACSSRLRVRSPAASRPGAEDWP